MNRIFALLMLGLVPVLALSSESSSDEGFFKSAAEGGLAEVAAGKLAESKATTPALKDFGGMMVKDHSTADQQLWKIASAKDIKMPTTASLEQVAARDRLKLLSGDSFDKAYIKNQIDAHRDTIALFKKEASFGHDPQAKEFATATLPTVQAHLDRIMKIAGSAGVSTD